MGYYQSAVHYFVLMRARGSGNASRAEGSAEPLRRANEKGQSHPIVWRALARFLVHAIHDR